MKSRIIQLPDLAGFSADPELTTIVVGEDEVQERILRLAKEHGEMIEQDEVTENCGVVCENEEGKKILLYPSMEMPGVSQAEKDVKEKKVGETFSAMIGEKPMTLTVQKILFHQSSAIDDMLAVRCGIEGVSTLKDLRKRLEEDLKDKKQEELRRMLIMQIQQYLCDHAQAEIDEDEINQWAEEQAKLSYEENMAMGIDLRFTEEGDMLSEEEVLAQLAEEMHPAFISMLVNRKFCEERGFVSDKEGIEADNECFPFVYQELSRMAEELLVKNP